MQSRFSLVFREIFSVKEPAMNFGVERGHRGMWVAPALKRSDDKRKLSFLRAGRN